MSYIYHETQRSHHPHLPRLPEVSLQCFDPLHAATSLAGKSELEVGFYERFDPTDGGSTSLTEPEVGMYFNPVRATSPSSLARASWRSVFINVLTPFVPPPLHCYHNYDEGVPGYMLCTLLQFL